MKITAEIRKDTSYYSVYANGQRMVDRESYQVAENVAFHLNNPQKWDYSESSEVADSIRLPNHDSAQDERIGNE